MKIITAPEKFTTADIFIAGGIRNCPLWQDDVISLLKDAPGTALNPRRDKEFSMTGISAEEQIKWEFEALHNSKTILFWFPKETLCPITLFELGAMAQHRDINLVVGTHPEYQRRFDVIIQLSLVRPEIIVRDNLEDVVNDYLSLSF